jgi:hypothetical protein
MLAAQHNDSLARGLAAAAGVDTWRCYAAIHPHHPLLFSAALFSPSPVLLTCCLRPIEKATAAQQSRRQDTADAAPGKKVLQAVLHYSAPATFLMSH